MIEFVNDVISVVRHAPKSTPPAHGLNVVDVLLTIPLVILVLVIIYEIHRIIFESEEQRQPNQLGLNENQNAPAGLHDRIKSFVLSPYVFLFNCLRYGFDNVLEDWRRLQNELMIVGTNFGPVAERPRTQNRKRSFKSKANQKEKSSETNGSKYRKRVKANSSPNELDMYNFFRNDKILSPLEPTDFGISRDDESKPISRQELKAMAVKLADDCKSYFAASHSMQTELGQDFVIVPHSDDSPIEDVEIVYNFDCEPESDPLNPTSSEEDDMIIV